MKVIYIAGPFRAPTSWGIEQNVRRAEEVGLRVWKAGYAALVPHMNTRWFQNEAPDEVWLEGDLEMLRRSDAVLTVEGWQNSTGTLGEITEAMLHNIPVFHSLEEMMKEIPA